MEGMGAGGKIPGFVGNDEVGFRHWKYRNTGDTERFGSRTTEATMKAPPLLRRGRLRVSRRAERPAGMGPASLKLRRMWVPALLVVAERDGWRDSKGEGGRRGECNGWIIELGFALRRSECELGPFGFGASVGGERRWEGERAGRADGQQDGGAATGWYQGWTCDSCMCGLGAFPNGIVASATAIRP